MEYGDPDLLIYVCLVEFFERSVVDVGKLSLALHMLEHMNRSLVHELHGLLQPLGQRAAGYLARLGGHRREESTRGKEGSRRLRRARPCLPGDPSMGALVRAGGTAGIGTLAWHDWVVSSTTLSKFFRR